MSRRLNVNQFLSPTEFRHHKLLTQLQGFDA